MVHRKTENWEILFAVKKFNEFRDGGYKFTSILEAHSRSPQQRSQLFPPAANLIYLTDWLQFWVISGAAHIATRSDFTLYLQVALTAIAIEGGVPKTRRHPLIPTTEAQVYRAERPSWDSGDEKVTFPTSLTEEFYDACKSLSPKERVRQGTDLLKNTEHYRSQ